MHVALGTRGIFLTCSGILFGVGLLTSHSLQLQKQIKNRLQALALRGLKMRAELVTRI